MTEGKDGGDAASDDHVFLLGRPPMAEYLTFVKSQSVGGIGADLKDLSSEWRQANAHIRQLEIAETSLANQVRITPLPPELENEAGKLREDPIFKRSFFAVPVELGMVELDRLVVFQKEINLTFVGKLHERLGSNPSAEQIFRFCLPYDHPQAPVRHFQVAQNAYVFVSPSNDLRVLDLAGFQGNPLEGYNPSGPVAGVLSFVVGFGSNFLNALRVEGRLVLNNGSHRAYALREAGVKVAPCIIQSVSNREELEAVASGDVAQRADQYLKAPRPPLLKDYFDPALRKVLKIPRKVRQVRVTFSVESLDIPGT